MLTIENYKNEFEKLSFSHLENTIYTFQTHTNNNVLQCYFDLDAVIFKLSNKNKFYALKCYTNVDINSKEYLNAIENDIVKFKEILEEKVLIEIIELEILNSKNIFQKTKLLLLPWIENITYFPENINFIKQIHDKKSLINHNKKRKNIKIKVIISIFMILSMIVNAKIFLPNISLLTPIDYAKLVKNNKTVITSFESKENIVIQQILVPQEIKTLQEKIKEIKKNEAVKIENKNIIESNKKIKKEEKIKQNNKDSKININKDQVENINYITTEELENNPETDKPKQKTKKENEKNTGTFRTTDF